MGLEEELRQHCDGEVRFDKISKEIYSVDASIFEVEPLGVFIPHNKEAVVAAIAIAARYGVSIIARGAATGITGGCLGPGLIIDCAKYLNQIIAIDYAAGVATCGPGVVQDRLNDALAEKGFRLGPDTSTGNRATLGGMLSNNAAGARSLRFGKMSDHILEVELALASGEVITLQAIDEDTLHAKMALTNREGAIYRDVIAIRDKYHDAIEKRFPRIPRRVSGYNLEELLKPMPLNLSKLIAGSEGTFGVVLELKVKIVPCLKHTGLCLLFFHSICDAVAEVEAMLAFQPLSLEMIDDKIIAMGSRHPAVRDKLKWLVGSPGAVIAAEFDGSSIDELARKLEAFKASMEKLKIGYCQTILLEQELIKDVWEVRKAGLGLLLSKRSYSRAIAFIEDISVPPQQLSHFMQQFLDYMRSAGKEAGIYGHVGAGCMHIRPYIDLRDPSERTLMKKIMRDVMALLLQHGGTLSGEHGDGYIRSWLNKELFGEELYEAFCRLKQVFDPLQLMNPGKVVHPVTWQGHLHRPPVREIETFLDFSSEGGFALAVDMCNGNGLCRKSETVMCPSFQATGDEYDTTRARTQALRAIISGKMPTGDLASQEVHDILDLCLECKGCKRECPSSVDMAKMKAEVLYHYQEQHGYRWRNLLFGHIDTLYRILSPFAGLNNMLQGSLWTKKLLDYSGIAFQRDLPELAQQRFSHWFKRLQQTAYAREIVLFNDTYNEFNEPKIGQAAVAVAQALGYRIVVLPYHCCGRPLISKGILKSARQKASRLVELLYPYALRGCMIIGLEPSCIFTIKDDYVALLSHDQGLAAKAKIVAQQCVPFDLFIYSELHRGALPLQFKEDSQKALWHGHCHQKALLGCKEALAVLQALPGYEVAEINSGCCGMAGSFGYEKEHWALSMKIGGLKLFPAVANAHESVQIIANGVSCRSQIAAGTGRHALHLAEAMAQRLV